MNIATRFRRDAIASSLAVAERTLSTCGAGELEADENLVELERDGERAEAPFTVEK